MRDWKYEKGRPMYRNPEKLEQNYTLEEDEIWQMTHEKLILMRIEDLLKSQDDEKRLLEEHLKDLLAEEQEEEREEQELLKKLQQADLQLKTAIANHSDELAISDSKFDQIEGILTKNSEHIRKLNIQYEQKERQYIEQGMHLNEEKRKEEFLLSQLRQHINMLNNKKQQSAMMESEIKRVMTLCKKNQLRTQEMFNHKKKLNNDLQDKKGTIRVYCRIRPAKQEKAAVKVFNQHVLNLIMKKDNVKSQHQEYIEQYMFDNIFNQNHSQHQIFSQVSSLVQNSIDGKNVCIFAYGQTGSGKTYTLHGPDDEQQLLEVRQQNLGMASRSIQLIFEQIERSKAYKWEYKVYLSIQQIYREIIIDLIEKTTVAVDKYNQIIVTSSEQVQSKLREAKMSRKIATTNCNERSSRSHLIVMLRLEGTSPNNVNGSILKKKSGSLVLVDLAGSERLKQSKVEGDLLRETQFINKSLSHLGTVINSMRKKDSHIPFRGSKLTHVLQRYLEGQSKTLMFVNISPDQIDSPQTRISLTFAQGVRETKTGKK